MRSRIAFIALLLLAPSFVSAAITSDLRYGSKGPLVSELQQFLKAQNILVGTPTGNFYTITQNGVKTFQRLVGLPQTGFVGPMTRAEINVRLLGAAKASSTPAVSTPTIPAVTASTSPEVAALIAQVQKMLGGLPGGNQSAAITQTVATSTTPFEFDQKWRNAVVNLFCTDRYGGGLSSGSGVIIDPRGIILTNAHVALDFLFQDWPNPSITECVVRTGMPAYPTYKAMLIYFPQGYVQDTVSAQPGASDDTFQYGKDDYALLVITGPSNAQVSMPASFPYMPMNFAPPAVKTPVYLLGYASEYASYESLQRSLYQLASPATVDAQQGLQGSRTIDAVAFNGNVVGQHGSSGGAVILNGGQIAGLMTFFDRNPGQTTSEKVLNAITTGYIARDFETDTTVPFATFMANDPLSLAARFASTTAPVYQKAFAQMWKSRGITIPGYYQ
jgi:peptidoglycan hydrolase-like protein with peptidoglycan-binding domain